MEYFFLIQHSVYLKKNKMKNKIITVFLVAAVLFIGCKKDSGGDDNTGGTPTPQPGTTRVITVDLTYHTGLITGTTSWAAWPMIKFPVDNNAKSYKVRLYGFSTTVSGLEGKVYTWKAGDAPPTPYNVFPNTKDIKDGYYYMVVDRSWCSGDPSGCNENTANEFVARYKAGWGNPKGEVTYQY